MYKLTIGDILYFIISIVISFGIIGWAIYAIAQTGNDAVDYVEVNSQGYEQSIPSDIR